MDESNNSAKISQTPPARDLTEPLRRIPVGPCVRDGMVWLGIPDRSFHRHRHDREEAGSPVLISVQFNLTIRLAVHPHPYHTSSLPIPHNVHLQFRFLHRACILRGLRNRLPPIILDLVHCLRRRIRIRCRARVARIITAARAVAYNGHSAGHWEVLWSEMRLLG